MSHSRYFNPLLMGLGCFIWLTGCSSSNTDSEITFSHITGDRSEWHLGAERFKTLVEQRSQQAGDPIEVTLFTQASLSNNNQQTELDNIQGGSLVMSWESSILLSTLDPAWSVFSLPWLLDDYQQAETLCTGPLGQEMLQRLETKRLVGLGYGFNGFRQITNNKRPIIRPDDLIGLKIRVPSIQMYIALFSLWQAQPSSMNFGELIPALRSGAMDGQENPLHIIHSAKLFEVQMYLTVWQYSFDPLVLCVNRDWWNRQSASRRDLLRTCAAEACAAQRQIVRDNEATHLQELQQQGMEIVTLTALEREVFRQSAASIYDDYRNQIGGELLDRFVQQAQQLRNSQ